MDKKKKRSVAAGLTGLTAAGLLAAPEHADAAAQAFVQLADGRPLLFAGIFLPVVGWVAFNILQPALRQVDAQLEKNSAPVDKKGKKK